MDEQNQASLHKFLQSESDDARGSVAWYLLPVLIVLRPGRFMLSWGIHASIFWILLAAWIAGAGRMTNWVINQQRMSTNPLPFRIDSWAGV